MIVRHYDRIGLLRRILTDFREAKITVHEVHNIVFEGVNAAVARIQIDKYPSREALERFSSRNEVSTKAARPQLSGD